MDNAKTVAEHVCAMALKSKDLLLLLKLLRCFKNEFSQQICFQ